MSTTTEPIVKEEVAPTPQVVEAPAQETVKTEEVKTEEEPAAAAATTTTEEEVAETSVGETTPQPTTSKSNPTNRLSLFLGKAKTFVEKVHEKKPAVPKKESATEEEVTTEPVVSSPVTEEPPVTTEEPVTRDVETKVPKAEKRKSILAGIFRSKSPVNKEVEKSEDVTPATEVAKPDETVADKETQETPAVASASGVVEEESTVEQAEKENVIDHIKRGPLGKFFNKKKETEHKEEPVAATTETEAAPVITEPVVTEETPAAEVVEPVVEATTTSAPAQPEEKVARSGSPLGRRITQMFRGFSSKKKVPTVAATEEPAKEENTREIVAETTATAEDAPAVTEAPAAIEAPVAVAKEEEEQQEKPADVAVPAQVPAAQPTA